jgi:hypothetical protein
VLVLAGLEGNMHLAVAVGVGGVEGQQVGLVG